MNYTYYDVDLKTFGTYPIKTVSDAFKDLKVGKNTVLIKTPTSGQVSLRSIYLAYYQSENYTPYLQPVYVFEGENFAAYVVAIPNDYLAQ